MKPDLPSVIESYFAAGNANDAARIAAHFTADARVKDEGRWRAGVAEIEDWAREARAKYQYTATPLAIEEDGDARIVTAHLVGNFPGSPVDLRYRFELAEGKIARLEIV